MVFYQGEDGAYAYSLLGGITFGVDGFLVVFGPLAICIPISIRTLRYCRGWV
jgi:hypothetical protein